MNAKWSERGREIILKLIALPVPLLRQVSNDFRRILKASWERFGGVW